ncbi:MAG: DUF1203 domain-containing protein [Pseudomonadota bacterium]
MTFQIHALPVEAFEDLFSLSDAELSTRNIHRVHVDKKPGAPCRVSLADADVGETVLLLNFQHQPADSPYQSSHAIYVREGAVAAEPAKDDVPEMIRSRLISMRIFDADDMIVAADVIEGAALAEALETAFKDDRAAYGHLHFAQRGCFAAKVTRA